MNQQPINVGEAVKICVEVTIKKFLNSEELKGESRHFLCFSNIFCFIYSKIYPHYP